MKKLVTDSKLNTKKDNVNVCSHSQQTVKTREKKYVMKKKSHWRIMIIRMYKQQALQNVYPFVMGNVIFWNETKIPTEECPLQWHALDRVPTDRRRL